MMGLLLCLPLAVCAGFDTGRELQSACEATTTSGSRARAPADPACAAFLVEVVDAATRHSMGIAGSCLPYGVSRERLRLEWLEYASANARLMDLDADDLVRQAFGSVWPCDNR